jgi:hypothetical protein
MVFSMPFPVLPPIATEPRGLRPTFASLRLYVSS